MNAANKHSEKKVHNNLEVIPTGNYICSVEEKERKKLQRQIVNAVHNCRNETLLKEIAGRLNLLPTT